MVEIDQVRKGSKRLKIKAPAKVNLFLEITGEQDGFHQIVTVMQTISLCDILDIEIAPDGQVDLTVDGAHKVPSEDNLVSRAAHLLLDYCRVEKGARIRLTKNVPAGAGLGGGSSDAAAALTGLNDLWELGLTKRELQECAASLGSDIPFFIDGGCCICTGRGERVVPVEGTPLNLVLLVPDVHVSTAQVYRQACHDGDQVSEENLLRALPSGDPKQVGRHLFNRLQETTVQMVPEVKEALAVLGDQGLCGVIQSGSGGAVFGLADSPAYSRDVAAKLVGAGFQAWSLESPAG